MFTASDSLSRDQDVRSRMGFVLTSYSTVLDASFFSFLWKTRRNRRAWAGVELDMLLAGGSEKALLVPQTTGLLSWTATHTHGPLVIHIQSQRRGSL